MTAPGMPDILRWTGDALRFLDQTALPAVVRIEETRDYRAVVAAITTLQLRGAPLIGLAGAYASLLAARELRRHAAVPFQEAVLRALDEIAHARPTAVNLKWAVTKCAQIVQVEPDPDACVAKLERLALDLHADNTRRCAEIGRRGADLIPHGAGVLTHCNTGALATGGEGTALSIILAAQRQGKQLHQRLGLGSCA